MSVLQKLQKAHRYFFASSWTWWWHLLPNLLRQDVMARKLCWSFRHYPYYWRWRRAYELSKMQWKGKFKWLSNKGPFIYYGSVFWGFFEPPTCLKTGAEKKNSKRTIVKHYCVYYLLFASVFTFVSLFQQIKIDIDIIWTTYTALFAYIRYEWSQMC